MDVVVVIPTYNEAENILSLLRAVLEHDVRVLVVDDNSPDGTGELVKKFMVSEPRVELLTGKKQGLGAAYIRGFSHAIEKMGAKVLIEMDADGSHDPSDIPRLLAALEQADFVIGSRYVPGGEITGWGWYRHLVSSMGNLVARIVSGMVEIHDCTAGFRAIRADVVKDIDWTDFSGGYSFQIRLLSHALNQGCTVTEIPVTFTDREHGDSKLGFSDIIGFCWVAAQMGMNRSLRLAKFFTVGAIGIGVNVAAFWVLAQLLSVTDWISIAAASEVSILSNFFLHDAWTFRDRHGNELADRLSRYHLTSLGGILLTYLAYYLIMLNSSLSATLGYTLSVCIAAAWNFLVSYFWAWSD